MTSKTLYLSPAFQSFYHLQELEFVKTQYEFTGTLQPCDAIILDDGNPFDEWSFTVSNLGSNPQINIVCDPNSGASTVQLNAVNTDGNPLGCTFGGNPETGSFIPAGEGTALVQIFANAAAGSDSYQLTITGEDCDVSNVQQVTNSCTAGTAGCPA